MPMPTARLNIAVVLIGLVIALLASLGSVKTTWSCSAFTVLIYYAVTNLAALRLSNDDRLYALGRGLTVACAEIAPKRAAKYVAVKTARDR